VHLLVRSAGLADTMSRYLIRRIEETPTIVLRPHTEIVVLEGGDYLESVRWRNKETGQAEEHKIRHVFVMAGAVPNTRWLDGCVTLDAKGFIKTGPVLSPDDLSAAHWPLARPPYLLEPACQEYSQSATCVAAASNALRPQLAKDRSQFHSFIKYYRNSNGSELEPRARRQLHVMLLKLPKA
jgi:hypothetical protein